MKNWQNILTIKQAFRGVAAFTGMNDCIGVCSGKIFNRS